MRLIFAVVVSLLLHRPPASAADPFAKQPAMSGAYNKLNAALTHVEKSRAKTPAKHRDAALLNLQQAKTFLEEAKKNKGSSRPAAIKLIDQATAELQATPPADEHARQAADLIKKALHEVAEAAKAGR